MSLIGRQGFGLGFPPPAPAEDVGGASESPQHQRQNDDVLLASSTQRQQQRKDPRENLCKQCPKYGGKNCNKYTTYYYLKYQKFDAPNIEQKRKLSF